MPILQCVSLIGDSNIKRHMVKTNCRDRPVMLGAQVIQCGRLPLLSASLTSIRAESNVCVLSCVTNFVTSLRSGLGASSLSSIVEPVFEDFLSKVTQTSESRPDVSFLICPPMYRLSPIWYREGLPEILQKFSDVMKSRPPNCHLMSSFPTPCYESDGVHLTAYSGLEFVLHLFDTVTEILTRLELDVESRSSLTVETSRVLEDRVMVLEQDHRRLNSKFEHKFAVDSELFDFQENLRNEPFFMIRGLTKLPKLEPKEWQQRAQSDVQEVLKAVMGKEYPISYIMNSTARGKDAIPQYKVRLPSAALSKEIRDTFGALFVGGDKRPPALKKISIRNCVTPATLGRIAILQLLGTRYKDSNPGSSYKVLGYDPRPLLKIFPADGESRRVLTFNFIEAISELPTAFSAPEIGDLLKRISPKLHGKLKSLFVVLSDDMLRPKRIVKAKTNPNAKTSRASGAAPGGASGSESSSSFKTPPSLKRGAGTPPSGATASKK